MSSSGTKHGRSASPEGMGTGRASESDRNNAEPNAEHVPSTTRAAAAANPKKKQVTASAAAERACAKCGQRGTGFDHCGRCKRVHYCSRACQRAHWKASHRHACRPPGKEDDAVGDTKTCAICWEDFDESDRKHDRILPLACRHRFHSACINGVQRSGVATNHLCPVCRKELPVSIDTLVADAWTLMTRADKGKLSGAEQKALMAEAEAKLREALGREPDNGRVLHDLAQRLRGRGELTEAAVLYQRALAVREAKFGSKHVETLNTVHNLASVWRAQGQYAPAETLHRRAVAGFTEKLGATHQRTLMSTNCLAVVLSDQEGKPKQDEAARLYRRVLAAQEATLGTDHENTLVTASNLAVLLTSQGEHAEALPLKRRVLAGTMARLGAEHPHTLVAVGNLARTLEELRRFDEAEPLYRRALAGQEARHGPSHPNTVLAVWCLAVFFEARGQYAEAAPLFHRVANGAAAHPDNAICRGYLDQNPHAIAAECERRAKDAEAAKK